MRQQKEERQSRRVQEVISTSRRRKIRTRVVSVLAAFVVGVTTVSMVMPANTATAALICGKEEHTHTDECYTTEKVLTCGQEESADHQHTDACYTEQKVLTCGKEEHTHTEACYEQGGNLTGEIKEKVSVSVGYDAGVLHQGTALSVNTPSADALNSDRNLISSTIGKNSALAAIYDYDLSFSKNGQKAEPDGKVNVTIVYQGASVPADLDVKDSDIQWKLYHISGGKAEEITKSGNDFNLTMINARTAGSAKFKADSFSDYALVAVVPAEAVEASSDNTQDTPAASTESASPASDSAIADGSENTAAEAVSGFNSTEAASSPDTKADSSSSAVIADNADDSSASVTLTADADDGTASVLLTADADAGIPEDAVLKVTPVSDSKSEVLLDAAKNELDLSDSSEGKVAGQFYDITILDKDGKPVEPKTPVEVRLTLKDSDVKEAVADETQDVQVVHFADNKKAQAEEVAVTDQNAKGTDAELTFQAESFSTYGVIYTVDFTHDGYTYSIAGESSIKLSELMDKLGITDFDVKNVEDVTFTDKSLVKVEKELIGKDWTLTSLAPFQSNELLTVIMKDGSKYEIKVTDQPSSEVTSGRKKIDSSVANPYNANLQPTNETVTYDENTEKYNADFKVNFVIQPATVKANNYSFYLPLGDLQISDDLLNREFNAKDPDKEMNSFKYKYVKDDDGKYYVLVDYYQDYINSFSTDETIKNNYIQFNGSFDDFEDKEGKENIHVTDNIDVTVPDSQINYPENKSKSSDISTSKAYGGYYVDDNNIIHVKYTAHFSSKKGTDKNSISVSDTLTANQSNGTGYDWGQEPKVTSAKITNVTGSSTTIPSDASSTQNTDGSVTLSYTLPALTAGGSYDVSYEYTYDKAFLSDLSASEYSATFSGNNNISVKSGKLKDKDSAPYNITKDRNPVNGDKSGSLDKNNNVINWTINASFQNLSGNSGPYSVEDASFSDESFMADSLIIKDSEGNAVTGYTLENGSIKFTNPGQYTITYSTSVMPDPYKNTKVTNTATLKNGNTEKGIGPVDVSVPASNKINKAFVSSSKGESGTDAEGAYTDYTLTWHVSIPAPADGLPAGTEFTETLHGNIIKKASDYYNHWLTDDQKDALLKAFNDALDNNVSMVSAGRESETSNNYVFKAKLNNDWTNPDKIQNIEFDYTSTARVYTDIATGATSSSTSGDKFINNIKVGDVSTEANWEYQNLFNKLSRTGGRQVQDKVSKVTINRSGKKELTWDLVLRLDNDYTNIQFKDTLPAGLSLKNISVGKEYNVKPLSKLTPDANTMELHAAGSYDQVYDALGNVMTDIYYADDDLQNINPVATIDGQNITVDLSLQDGKTRPAIFTKGNKDPFYVRITAVVDDDQFDTYGGDKVVSYANNASVTADGQPKGDDSQTQQATLVPDTLSKGETHGDFTAEGSDHQIHYSLDINKAAVKLLGDNSKETTLTLDDVLSYTKPTDFNCTVTLDPKSVKLYEVVDGKKVEYDNPAEPWAYTFSEGTDKDDPTKKVKNIHLSGIPDEKYMILDYSYEINIENPTKGKTYKLPDINNKASLNGTQTVVKNKNVSSNWKMSSTSAGSSSAGILKIIKVDSQSYGIKLENAKFALMKYTASGWEYVNAISASSSTAKTTSWKDGNGKEWTVYTSNSDGIIQISQPSGGTKFDKDVAYKITEVEAPKGYAINQSTPEGYFYFSDTENGRDSMLWPDEPAYRSHADNLTFSSDSVWLTNTKVPVLTITKSFAGNLTDEQINALKDKLTFNVKGGTKNAIDKTIKFSEFTKDETTGKYICQLDEGIEDKATYTVTESNADITADGKELPRTTTYSINSHDAENGSSAEVPIKLSSGQVDFTNEYGTEKISATKVWDDNNNADGLRPTSITLDLYKDGVKVEGQSKTIKSTDANNPTAVWETATWTGLVKGAKYTVQETSVAGYDTSYTYKDKDGNEIPEGYVTDSGSSISVTNKRKEVTPGTTSILVKKKWQNSDGGGTDAPANTSVTVQVQRQKITNDAYYSYPKSTNWQLVNQKVYFNAKQGDNITLSFSGSNYQSKVVLEADENQSLGEINTWTPVTSISFKYQGPFKFLNGYNFSPDYVTITNASGGSSSSYSEDETYNDTAPTITLSSSNSWQGMLENLPLTSEDGTTSYKYYVKEISATREEKTYQASESDFPFEIDTSQGGSKEISTSTSGVTTMTITNKLTSQSYALPHTGSTGTTPYTAAGAALLGITAAGYVLTRRRRRTH